MMLQVPIPGGLELVILLFVLVATLLVLAVPLLVAVLVYRWWRGDDADEAEIAALRERVAKLEATVERRDDDR